MPHTRSFLKWAGGKYNLLNIILPYFPQKKRLIEPFAGSGAVFINTDFEEYIIAECNQDLIDIYNLLKEQGPKFIKYCEQYFNPECNQKDCYYTMRDLFNQSTNIKEKAAIFLYLNRHGYNGLCRYNSSGKYNVPFGKYLAPYFPHTEMLHFYLKSQNATFIHQDFRETFKNAQKEDVIYCDPPYVPLSKTASFTHYSTSNFTENDQLALLELAKEVQKKGCTVLISNHDSDFTLKNYTDCKIIKFNIRRKISCKADGGRNMVKEILAIFT